MRMLFIWGLSVDMYSKYKEFASLKVLLKTFLEFANSPQKKVEHSLPKTTKAATIAWTATTNLLWKSNHNLHFQKTGYSLKTDNSNNEKNKRDETINRIEKLFFAFCCLIATAFLWIFLTTLTIFTFVLWCDITKPQKYICIFTRKLLFALNKIVCYSLFFFSNRMVNVDI